MARSMKRDTDFYEEARKREMQRLANDPLALEMAIREHPFHVYLVEREVDWQQRTQQRKKKIQEDFEYRSEAAKRGWDKRRKRERLEADKAKYMRKRGGNSWPRVRIDHGFGGEFCERFQLHCEIPEELMGFDLAAELYEEPESRYDSLVHYLRAKRRKDA